MTAATPLPTAPAPRRSIGIGIRLALLVSWLGLYGYHAGGHLMVSLGLVEQQDTSSVVLAHLDHRYRYGFFDRRGTEVGFLSLGYQFVDAHYEIEMDLGFDRTDFIPGMNLLLKRFEQHTSGPSLRMSLVNRLDDQFRMRELEGTGNLFGINGTFTGAVTPVGLVGKLTAPAYDLDREFTLAAFDEQASAGFDLMIALPDDLEVGDQFQNQVIGVDWKPPFVKRQTVTYLVEEQTTGSDGLALHRISITQDGRAIGTLFADLDGIIRETAHQGTGLTLRLTTIFKDSVKIWPVDTIETTTQ